MSLSLPPYTFIMSDHDTRQLACDVAEAFNMQNEMVYVDDFLAPIYEGLGSMFSRDWKDDCGLPKNTNRLLLPALKESTEGDMIKNLEKWFVEQFGPNALGRMAVVRAAENLELADYSLVFRDASPAHVEAFLKHPTIAKRDMMFLHLGGPFKLIGTPSIDVLLPIACTPEEMVELVRSAL